MNKTVKIMLAVIAVLVISVVCSAFFFSGSIAKLLIENDSENYPNIRQTVGEYEHYGEKVPDSFKEVSMYGVSLRIPENAERASEDTSDRRYHIFKSPDDSLEVNFLKDYEEAFYGYYTFMLSMYPEEAVRKDMSCFNVDVEMNNYSMTSFIRSFTTDQIKNNGIHSFISAMRYANVKSASCQYEQSWNFDTDGAKGFVDFIGCEDGVYTYKLVLYDKDDLNDIHIIKINSSNEKLIRQIIDSAKLETE